MINYSVALRANPSDRTAPKKAYARVQLNRTLTLDQFAEHIATHGSKYDRGDIYAVLVTAGRCLRELVLQGNKVSLGDLGAFSPTIQCNGAESLESFTASHIKGLTLVWDKPANMENMRLEAQFQQVSSRAAQAAALKAEKEGKNSATWDSTTAPDGEGDSTVTPDNDTDTPGNDNTGNDTGNDNTGGNQGGSSDDDDANA